ncbi:hypothetical protein ACFXKC_33065 [Streptomyces sp. NPDC059340]|uniref:hypothetical protein n=1 Tax=Streptomyces sp. NPDC059340 TaxID=3346806 RepID=UPI0036AC8251
MGFCVSAGVDGLSVARSVVGGVEVGAFFGPLGVGVGIPVTAGVVLGRGAAVVRPSPCGSSVTVTSAATRTAAAAAPAVIRPRFLNAAGAAVAPGAGDSAGGAEDAAAGRTSDRSPWTGARLDGRLHAACEGLPVGAANWCPIAVLNTVSGN